jgi:hypothetical protein
VNRGVVTNMCLTVSGEKEGHCGIGVVTEAFPMGGGCPPGQVPTAAASIPSPKVGECWNSSLDAWLEAVVASIQL